MSIDPGSIDALFEALAARKRVGHLRDTLGEPDFWRRLNPQLTISETPIAPRLEPVPLPHADAVAHADFLQQEGYLLAPQVFDPAAIAPLREAVDRIVAQGLPPGMAWVYDEFYSLFHRIERVLEPMLGSAPLLLPRNFWVFHVPPGRAGRAGFGAYGPHRDHYLDRAFLAGERPSVMNVWIPLTDVTPLDSCMYVVHPDGDEDYWTEVSDIRDDAFDLTDIRAVPAPAGSVVAFSTRAAHWGSRSSRYATGPRIAVTCAMQRRDAAPFCTEVLDVAQPLSFDRRWALILDSVGDSGLEGAGSERRPKR